MLAVIWDGSSLGMGYLPEYRGYGGTSIWEPNGYDSGASCRNSEELAFLGYRKGRLDTPVLGLDNEIMI